MKKVLVADHPATIPRMLDMIGSGFDLVICTSLDQAVGMLGGKIGLIMCGVHFDHGRMSDLLHAAKTHPDVAPIRFLGIRLFDDELNENHHGNVQTTLNRPGIDGMLDVAQWKRSVGEDYAKAKLRIWIDHMALDRRQIDHRDGKRRKKLICCSHLMYA